MAARWYVIHTYSGQESRAKAALLERAKTHGREASIEDVFIPEESVTEVVKGQRRTSKRKFLPDDEVWHIVKNTSKITGFVGAGSMPTPIPDEDVGRMIGQAQNEKPKPKFTFEEGESVRVINGPFSNFSGTVSDVRSEKEQVQVLVSVFGRSTPVWLSFEHVEKA